jgi:P27 family predicted phage terminase small subunit
MWKTQSKILIDRGVFELEDAPLLLAYCNAFHLMLEAEKLLASGLTSESEMGGLKKHPAVNVRNDSVSQLPAWALFGVRSAQSSPHDQRTK